jgi:hypothetical protein
MHLSGTLAPCILRVLRMTPFPWENNLEQVQVVRLAERRMGLLGFAPRVCRPFLELVQYSPWGRMCLVRWKISRSFAAC